MHLRCCGYKDKERNMKMESKLKRRGSKSQSGDREQEWRQELKRKQQK